MNVKKVENGYILRSPNGEFWQISSADFWDIVHFGELETAKEDVSEYLEDQRLNGTAKEISLATRILSNDELLRSAAERLLEYRNKDCEGDGNFINIRDAVNYVIKGNPKRNAFSFKVCSFDELKALQCTKSALFQVFTDEGCGTKKVFFIAQFTNTPDDDGVYSVEGCEWMFEPNTEFTVLEEIEYLHTLSDDSVTNHTEIPYEYLTDYVDVNEGFTCLTISEDTPISLFNLLTDGWYLVSFVPTSES